MNDQNVRLNGSIQASTLPFSTRIAHARFRVSNLERSVAFYQDLVGMVLLSKERHRAILSGNAEQDPVLYLTEDATAPRRNPRSPGLFHMALLYPRRSELARVFMRLHEVRWPFQGFADHGVSEALYLADPDANGIELYIDRPRDDWPYRNGELQMVTEPLDVQSLLSELRSPQQRLSATATDVAIGHMHLQVSDLNKAEEFYHGALGFDVTQRNFPGALFMSAGGYHHHIGVNTWNSRGASSSPEGAAGLSSFALALADASSAESLRETLRPSPYWNGEVDGGFQLRDPDGLRLDILI